MDESLWACVCRRNCADVIVQQDSEWCTSIIGNDLQTLGNPSVFYAVFKLTVNLSISTKFKKILTVLLHPFWVGRSLLTLFCGLNDLKCLQCIKYWTFHSFDQIGLFNIFTATRTKNGHHNSIEDILISFQDSFSAMVHTNRP